MFDMFRRKKKQRDDKELQGKLDGKNMGALSRDVSPNISLFDMGGSYFLCDG